MHATRTSKALDGRPIIWFAQLSTADVGRVAGKPNLQCSHLAKTPSCARQRPSRVANRDPSKIRQRPAATKARF
jgi:hypothetical protein